LTGEVVVVSATKHHISAVAPVQGIGVLGDRQIVRAVNHRFALSKPALVSAFSKKSFSSASSPILACSDFTSTAGCAPPLPPGPKPSAARLSSCAFQECKLIGVAVELLHQLDQRSIALDGGKRHRGLEGRCVVPPRSSAHGLS
jgi:hypothetical protein